MSSENPPRDASESAPGADAAAAPLSESAAAAVEVTAEADSAARAAEVRERLLAAGEGAKEGAGEDEPAATEEASALDQGAGDNPQTSASAQAEAVREISRNLEKESRLRGVAKAAGYTAAAAGAGWAFMGVGGAATWGAGAIVSSFAPVTGAAISSAGISVLGAALSIAWPVALGMGTLYLLHKLPDILEKIGKGEAMKISLGGGGGGGHAKKDDHGKGGGHGAGHH